MANRALAHLIDRLKTTLSRDGVDEVLDELRGFVRSIAPKLYNEVLLHSANARQIHRDSRAQLLTAEQASVARARLRAALLDLLDELAAEADPMMLPLDGTVAMLAAPPPPESIALQRINSINSLRQVSWLERGAKMARAVGRVLTPNGVGTGFLVAPKLIMTNHHVIPDEKTAAGSVFELDYQQDGSGQLLPSARYALDPARFRTSPADHLDYTLVSVKADPAKPPLESYGVLRLNADSDPRANEHVVIVQHPLGGLKQIAATANQVVAVNGSLLHYATDTLPGSSGSPVFNDTWFVIAIHHAEGPTHTVASGERTFVNEGILMSAIKRDAGSDWPGG